MQCRDAKLRNPSIDRQKGSVKVGMRKVAKVIFITHFHAFIIVRRENKLPLHHPSTPPNNNFSR